MHTVRRRIGGGLVAGMAMMVLMAWTSGQQPQPQRQSFAAAPDTGALDCMSCHPRAHAITVPGGRSASVLCTTCHQREHEAVQALFRGRAADSVLQPDRMFLARVGCRACHTNAALAATTPALRLAAFTRACTSCHGSRFQTMLPRWSEAMGRHTRDVDAYVTAASADRSLEGRDGVRARLDSARANVSLVVKGVGVHNVVGADALLRSAVRKTGAAYTRAGLPIPSTPALGPDPSAGSCAYCHYGVETASGTIFGQSFRHADHVASTDIACTRCHSSATYFVGTGGQPDPAHGKTTVTAAECSACHHVTSSLACTACHTRQSLAGRAETVTMPLHLQPKGAPTSRAVAFTHDAHAAVACVNCHTSRAAVVTVASCATCHDAHHRQAADCATCHGPKLLVVHKTADHLICAQCHARATLELLTGDRTFCVSCHVDKRDHKPGRECAPCHLQLSPTEVKDRILGRKP